MKTEGVVFTGTSHKPSHVLLGTLNGPFDANSLGSQLWAVRCQRPKKNPRASAEVEGLRGEHRATLHLSDRHGRGAIVAVGRWTSVTHGRPATKNHLGRVNGEIVCVCVLAGRKGIKPPKRIRARTHVKLNRRMLLVRSRTCCGVLTKIVLATK